MEKDVPLNKFIRIHKLHEKEHMTVWIARFEDNLYVLKIFLRDKLEGIES